MIQPLGEFCVGEGSDYFLIDPTTNLPVCMDSDNFSVFENVVQWARAYTLDWESSEGGVVNRAIDKFMQVDAPRMFVQKQAWHESQQFKERLDWSYRQWIVDFLGNHLLNLLFWLFIRPIEDLWFGQDVYPYLAILGSVALAMTYFRFDRRRSIGWGIFRFSINFLTYFYVLVLIKYHALTPFGVFLLTTGSYIWASRCILDGLGYDQGENVVKNSQGILEAKRYKYFTANSWWRKIFLQKVFDITVGKVNPEDPLREHKRWVRSMEDNYRQGRDRRGLGYENSDEDPLMAEILGLKQLVMDLTHDRTEKEVPAIEASPPSYDACQTFPLAAGQGMTMETYTYKSISFLDESTPGLEAGTTTFHSRASASVLRVVSSNGTEISGRGTSFKVGNDKIASAAHLHEGGSNRVVLGAPMLDSEGHQLNAVVELNDGRTVTFPLIPYYRSKDGDKDFVLCHLPVSLRSSVPGLKARMIHPETDTEVAIIGYPASSSHAQFSTSPVKDSCHMTGSSGGMSGSPIIVRGRTVVGVHVGKFDGTTKKFHPFSDRDLLAIREPAPPCPTIVTVSSDLPVPSVRHESGKRDRTLSAELETARKDGKKQNRQRRINWADSTNSDDEDFFNDTERDRFYELEGYVKQCLERQNTLETLIRESVKAKPSGDKKAKNPKKPKKEQPCRNIRDYGKCADFDRGKCNRGSHHLQQKDFPKDSDHATRNGSNGSPGSARSLE